MLSELNLFGRIEKYLRSRIKGVTKNSANFDRKQFKGRNS